MELGEGLVVAAVRRERAAWESEGVGKINTGRPRGERLGRSSGKRIAGTVSMVEFFTNSMGILVVWGSPASVPLPCFQLRLNLDVGSVTASELTERNQHCGGLPIS